MQNRSWALCGNGLRTNAHLSQVHIRLQTVWATFVFR